jgi:hypothetical protein
MKAAFLGAARVGLILMSKLTRDITFISVGQLPVSSEFTKVTGRQTDSQTDRRTQTHAGVTRSRP